MYNYNSIHENNIIDILDWISYNIDIDYIDLFNYTISKYSLSETIMNKVYICYEHLIQKYNYNEKITAKYLIFLMKNLIKSWNFF